jgi:excisionase family DNA binding protein
MAIKDYMTPAEAADELGLAPQTVRAQIRKGKLRAERVGPVQLVTRRELERYRRDSSGQPGRRPKGGKR